MQLTPETLTAFSFGHIEDFVKRGALDLERTFPVPFDRPGVAADAAEKIVRDANDDARSLERPSELLAMRIAYGRVALGTGFSKDPRFADLVTIFREQASARTITDDTRVSEYIDAPDRRDRFRADLLAVRTESYGELTRRHAGNWDVLASSLASLDSARNSDTFKQFVALSLECGRSAGLRADIDLARHIAVSEAAGLRFFDDPLRPSWKKAYAAGASVARMELEHFFREAG